MGTDTPSIAVAVYFRAMTLPQLSGGEKGDKFSWSSLSAVFIFPKALLTEVGMKSQLCPKDLFQPMSTHFCE